MNYSQTLDYLYSNLPMFHRVGAIAYKADLHNSYVLSDILNHPEQKFPSVHIAGTNGKGSTSHMLASVFQEAGYKTGLYTSPHLKDFRERIRINGKKIPKSWVSRFIHLHKNVFEEIHPSFFEMTVALAFDYFAKEKVDIAIIETGLGGRLDSTNIITPILSLITNIGLDHVHILGSTKREIAGEKAGIIKKNVPVLIGETHPESQEVFLRKAQETGSAIYFADQLFHENHVEQGALWLQVDYAEYPNILSDMRGLYQVKNIKNILASVPLLNKSGWDIREEHVRAGLKKVKKNTGLLGRWQSLSKKPLSICDTGHNEDGIKEVLKNLALTPFDQLHFVLGMVADKDIHTILQMLPKEAVYYFCKANIPRALDEHILQQQARKAGLRGQCYSSVNAAYQTAKKNAKANDLVFVGGSTFTVAEVV